MSFKSLAPALLLSAPGIGDSTFERTVILLGKHNEEGALGWILNGDELPPVKELLLTAKLLPEDGLIPESDAFSRPARIGGPVAPETGWLVYTRKQARFEREIAVGDSLVVTGDAEALDAVLAGREPRNFHLLLGYTGWGPGQLENEMKAGAWLPTTVDPELLFPEDGGRLSSEKIWETAYGAVMGSNFIFGNSSWGSA